MPLKKGSFYKEIKCGSYSGYQRHYRLKEPACESCKKAASEYTLRYYHKNKDKIKKSPAYKAKRLRMKVRRYARKRGNRTEPYSFEQVIQKYGTVCYLCNFEIDMDAPRNCIGDNWEMGLHIDHVIDLQYGGPDSLDNVRPTHAKCNLNKSKIKPPSRKG
jgi:5-methylcytosine-specific restriction endonuclease McrA